MIRVLAVSPPRPGPWLDQLPRLVEAGVDGLLLRLVDAPGTLEAALARDLPDGLSVLVRYTLPGDEGLARERGLGLHLPAHLDPLAWRSRFPGRLSAACHDERSLRRADEAGIDMALLSPVFAPGSKPDDTRPPLGLEGMARLVAGVEVPVLALGGMDPARAIEAIRRGAAGAAGMGAFFQGDRVEVRGGWWSVRADRI